MVWLGDLNYRIPLPEAEVKEMLQNGKLESILHHDQLLHERKHKRAFAEFDEGRITFQPTYKYDPGTSIFDTSEKRRAPSWCDRILWRRGDPLSLLSYQGHMELMTSDHKPVSAALRAKIKTIRKDKQSEIHQTILRDLDKFENESMPDAKIDCNHFVFPRVEYLKPQTKIVTLENTGHVVAQFRFVPKLEESQFCKPWFWVNPPIGMMLPGGFSWQLVVCRLIFARGESQD